MVVKNDYNHCLTNLANSIRKYFELEAKHSSLEEVDKELQIYQPKNVVTILCDGMGALNMDKALTQGDFLIKNRIKVIDSVFPPTTVAATTSMLTGLNPCETGMLGWFSYYKDLDEVFVTFRSSKRDDPTDTAVKEAEEYFKKHMKDKPITEQINEAGKYQGHQLFPFGPNSFPTLDGMFDKIKELCHQEGKKYIYAYDTDPDSTMHKKGCDHPDVYAIIQDLNDRIERLSEEIEDTILFVVADHGHTNVGNLYLQDYPEIQECLKKTSLDARAINFFVKQGMEKEFVERFNEKLGKYFELHEMRDVMESHLFGDGEENEIFRDLLGDYLAIGTKDMTLLDTGGKPFFSHHSGYTDQEIKVPLVMVKTKKSPAFDEEA